jgi:hypothetical protein
MRQSSIIENKGHIDKPDDPVSGDSSLVSGKKTLKSA